MDPRNLGPELIETEKSRAHVRQPVSTAVLVHSQRVFLGSGHPVSPSCQSCGSRDGISDRKEMTGLICLIEAIGSHEFS
jgi:hypothetical protein